MQMGRERGVMRWDVRHSLISDRLALVEARLARLNPSVALDAPIGATPPLRSPKEERAIREESARLTTEREELRRQLRALGPSPRAKMG